MGEELFSDPDWRTAEEYHNNATLVFQITNRDARAAMEFVEKGLERFPYSPNLLADAVMWAPIGFPEEWDREGAEEGGVSQPFPWFAEDYFQIMKGDKRLWTWRCFDFAIDYLVDCKTCVVRGESTSEILEEALSLAEEFRTRFPCEERAHSAYVKVLLAQNKVDEAMALLDNLVFQCDNSEITSDDLEQDNGSRSQALTAGASSLPVAQCCVTYADMLIERGDFEKALQVARRGIVNTAQAQPSAKTGYFIYLEALCRDALLHRFMLENNMKFFDDKASEVIEIYALYETAFTLFETEAAYFDNIRSRVEIMKNLTKVRPSPEFESALARAEDSSSDEDDSEDAGVFQSSL